MARCVLGGLLMLSLYGTALGADAEADRAYQDGDYAKAMTLWRRDAAAGDGEADLRIGQLYDTGRGVSADVQQAADWYRRGAEAGNGTAAFNLAVLKDLGRVGRRDVADAVRWYRFAADHGSGRAALAMGMMAESGDGVPKNLDAAAGWYRLAQANGVPVAGERLAAVLVRQNEPAVLKETAPREIAPQDAASKPPAPTVRGGGKTVFEQAVALWRGEGLDAGGPAAFPALQAAAERGYPLAQYDLAYAYEHGIGTPVDLAHAYLWYGLAEAGLDAPALRAAAHVNRARLGGGLSGDERKAADALAAQFSGPPRY